MNGHAVIVQKFPKCWSSMISPLFSYLSVTLLKRTLQSLTQEVAAIFGNCALSPSPPLLSIHPLSIHPCVTLTPSQKNRDTFHAFISHLQKIVVIQLYFQNKVSI